jgi:hypothetical protein
VNGVTFVEDPAHPESWLRDCSVQSWDPNTQAWLDGPYLLSNASTHTHKFDKPIEGSKFRLINKEGYGWPAGNIRVGEIVFHGETVP